MVPERVLVVEDEKAIADILEYNLQKAGYDTKAVYGGSEALAAFQEFSPDLVLLDLMLPGENGISICRAIRLQSAVPVLMVTAKDSEEDVVQGLDAGADDYITKPFSPREVLARVRAHIRRSQGTSTQPSEDGILRFDRLHIDQHKHQAFVEDEDARLTRREYQLLLYLVERQGRVVTRKQLLQDVWDYSYYGDVRTVDVTIRRLREKIEADPSNPSFIATRRGVGYLFNGEPNVED